MIHSVIADHHAGAYVGGGVQQLIHQSLALASKIPWSNFWSGAQMIAVLCLKITVTNVPDPLPYLEISGPSIDDDIRRLIGRYGADKIREAIKRQTAGKRGRIPSGDWTQLRDVLREDARQWLEGENPFETRSNRSIAREFAEKRPGQSEKSTYRRLMGKLSKRRRYYTLVEAAWLSRDEYPHAENLRVVSELVAIGILRDQWQAFKRLHEASLADYGTKFGKPPASMTMQEILTEAARPITPSSHPSPGNVLQVLLGVRQK